MKMLNNKENAKKICDTFDYNFKIYLYVQWARNHSKGIILYYYDSALTLHN